jgi:prepilin-type processing-associated H-X9-DG protein/prepilin-type N-terminal cleavage/methylation domain-containing protein
MRQALSVRPSGARPGLTLVELIVVIAVVGILAALLLPTAAGARSRSRRMQCAHNLKSLGESLAVFSAEAAGTFPDVYYQFSGSGGTYDVTLRNSAADSFFRYVDPDALLCPYDNDTDPFNVTVKDGKGNDAQVRTSYAYNIALPTMYRNISRVSRTANIVSFYDGDASTVVGTWQPAPGWSGPTVRARHSNGLANYLFVDGHVEELPGIDETLAFNGGSQWMASALDTRPRVEPGAVAPLNLPDLPALPPDIGLFGNLNIIFGAGASIDKTLVSNGYIELGNGAMVTDVLCGGPLTSGSHPLISGSVLCGDTVNIGAGEIFGSVDAKGDIVAASITGDAATSGNIQVADTAGGRLYAGGNVTVGTALGRIIADGSVTVNDSAAADIQAGGDVIANAISGGVVSGGNVTLQGVSSGNVEAAGNVTVDVELTGSVECRGKLTVASKGKLHGSATTGNGALIDDQSTVNGDLFINGNVTVDKKATVNGNVQYTGSLTLGNGATVGSSTKVPPPIPVDPAAPLAAPAPASFQPVSLPAASSFTSGGEDVCHANGATVVLEPGSYGKLDLGTQCALTLSSGAYYFDSFTVANILDLTFNCARGNIQIYVEGNVSLGTMSSLAINDGGARNVYIETHGQFTTVNGTQWAGTVFAPNGDIVLQANCKITGALFSGAQLILGNGVTVHYVPPATN